MLVPIFQKYLIKDFCFIQIPRKKNFIFPGCFLFVLCFVVPTKNTRAQSPEILKPKEFQNAVYFELLGNGGLYSINYERIFNPRNSVRFFSRLGFGSVYYMNAFPIELGVLLGNGRNSKKRLNFEISLGTTPLIFPENKGKQIFDMYLFPRLGLRYESLRKRFLARLGVSVLADVYNTGEVWDDFNAAIPFAGLAIGSRF
jgi:hypothetical protein